MRQREREMGGTEGRETETKVKFNSSETKMEDVVHEFSNEPSFNRLFI